MKKLYEAVSDMILPGIVFVAVTAILTGAAVFGKIGNSMKADGDDFSHMADTQAVEAVCGRQEPRIQCIGKKVWKAGESVSIYNVFSAADENGSSLKLMVSDIISENGDSVLNCYHESTGQAVFPKRGAYTFCLETMDSERKISKERMLILVDDR